MSYLTLLKSIGAITVPDSSARQQDQLWNKLFSPLRESIISSLRRHYPTLNRADADDLADEVIGRLYRWFDFAQLDLAAPEQRGRIFAAFLKKVIQSAVTDHFRRTIRTPPEVSAERADIPLIRRLPATALVSSAFNRLDLADQQILRLKIIEGLTYRDILERYSAAGEFLTSSALKMRTLRALKKLKKHLLELGSAES